MHPFMIDADGHLYVDLGSATNACQAENRLHGSPGHDPCTELETRAGIWRYDANKTDQTFLARGALCHRHPQWRRVRVRQRPAACS